MSACGFLIGFKVDNEHGVYGLWLRVESGELRVGGGGLIDNEPLGFDIRGDVMIAWGRLPDVVGKMKVEKGDESMMWKNCK
ncbi:MAG: hypothetical protein AB7J46_02485 [Candidatus Altimarinota bacterium]